MINKNFAIVVSEFNSEITTLLLDGARERFAECNIETGQIIIYKVPGAFEIPLTAKLLAKSGKYNGIICLGAVIRGETTHYDYICQQVSNGCMQIMLECMIPVIFGILTTENEQQALARCGGDFGHKGRDAVDTLLAMSKVVDKILIN